MEERLKEDLKKAMKNGNTVEKNTIQLLRAEIIKAEKDKGCALTDAEIENITFKEKTKRTDALALFEKGNRKDLVEKTMIEITCLNRYLPKQLTDDEVEYELKQIIEELNADKSMFGKVMGYAKTKLGNRADGKKMSDILKKLLGV